MPNAGEGTVAGYKVTETAVRDVPFDGGDEVDRKECAPIAALIGGHLSVKPSSEVYRTVKPADPRNATVGNVWLSAYDSTRGLLHHRRTDLPLRRAHRSATAGQAAFRVTGEVGKQQITMNYRVVRAGTVVAGLKRLSGF